MFKIVMCMPALYVSNSSKLAVSKYKVKLPNIVASSSLDRIRKRKKQLNGYKSSMDQNNLQVGGNVPPFLKNKCQRMYSLIVLTWIFLMQYDV